MYLALRQVVVIYLKILHVQYQRPSEEVREFTTEQYLHVKSVFRQHNIIHMRSSLVVMHARTSSAFASYEV